MTGMATPLFSWRSACLASALVLSAAASPALAQLQGTILETSSQGRNVSVMQRDRPEYSSPGILVGGFILQPSVTAGIGGSTNVFLSDTNKSSDVFFSVAPRITANATWARNALSAEVHGDFKRFAKYSVRNETAFGGSIGGRYDIGVDSSINAQASFDRYYESQYDLTSIVGGASTIPVDNLAATVTATTGVGPVRFSVIGNAERLNYGSYTDLSGVLARQDNRDRASYAFAGQVDYAVADGTYLFAQLGYENIEYDTDLSAGVTNRDSEAVRAIAGISLDLTALIRGRVGVGYIHRNYRGPQFANAGGLAIEARLEYFLTELTTITLNGHRTLEDASTTVQGGYFRTGGDLRVDHELLRNLILSAVGKFEKSDFGPTFGNARVWQVQAIGKLLISPHLSFNGNITYAQRDQSATAIGNAFRDLRGLASIRYQF